MSTSTTTINHDTIRRWAEARDGHPARVEGTGSNGLLRIDFGEPEERLEAISWEEFFEVFEKKRLAFLYQDKLEDGQASRFNKIVSREAA